MPSPPDLTVTLTPVADLRVGVAAQPQVDVAVLPVTLPIVAASGVGSKGETGDVGPPGPQGSVELRRNYAYNPSLEVGTSGWVVAWGTNTFARVAVPAASPAAGSWCLGCTYQNDTRLCAHNVITLKPYTRYTISVYVYVPAGWGAGSLSIGDQGSWTGATKDSTLSATTVKGAWTRISLGITTAAVAVGSVYVVASGAMPPAGTVAYVDGMLIETADTITPRPYFDGDTPGAQWTDTAHGSESVLGRGPIAPPSLRRNLLANPSFEVDTARWSRAVTASSNTTRVLDATVPTAYGTGQYVAEQVCVASAAGEGMRLSDTPASGLLIPANPGDRFTVGALIKRQSGTGGQIRIQTNFRDNADVSPSGATTLRDFSYDDTWRWFTMTCPPAPAGTVWMRIYIVLPTAVADTFRVAGVTCERNAPAEYIPTYFDGSSQDAYWEGAAHASTSVWSAGGTGVRQLVEAKGDLIAGSAPQAPTRLPVGTHTQVLSADETAALGVRWQTKGGTVFSGAGVPTEATGANGDFWLTNPGGVLYGPRGGPTSQVNLVVNPSFEAATPIVSPTLGDPTNLVLNPSFEVDLTGWSGAGGPGFSTLARVAGGGGQMARATNVTNGGQYGMIQVAGGAHQIPATPGQTFGARIRLLAASRAGHRGTVQIFWRNSSNGIISTVVGTAVTPGDDSVIVAVAPALTVGFTVATAIAFADVAAGVAGDTMDWDKAAAFLLPSGATVADVPGYFDGSIQGYGWSGTAHASTSRMRAPLGFQSNDMINPKPDVAGSAFNGANSTRTVEVDATSPTGTALVVVTPTSTGDGFAYPPYTTSVSDFFPAAAPGETWTLSAWCKVDDAASQATTSNNRPSLELWHRTGTGTYPVARTYFTNSDWQRLNVSVTLPANANAFFARLYAARTVTNGSTRFAGMRLTRGAQTDYQDGSSPGWGWTGGVGTSPAREVTHTVTSWIPTGTPFSAHLAQRTDNAVAGSYGVRSTRTLIGTVGAYGLLLNVNMFGAMQIGVPYTLSASVRGVAGKGGQLMLSHRVSGSWVNASTTWTMSGGWERKSLTFTLPPATDYAYVYVQQTNGVYGEVLDVDAVLLTDGSTVLPYFDGSTPGYGWTGVAQTTTSRGLGWPATGTEITHTVSDMAIKAQRHLIGGGNRTYDAVGVAWSARLLVIGAGRGPSFATGGYWMIDMPPDGTVIPGVGAVTSKTVTGGRVPLTTGAYEGLFYVLPLGSTSTSLPGNFRVAGYSSGTFDVPAHWILVCQITNDSPAHLLWGDGVLQSQNAVRKPGKAGGGVDLGDIVSFGAKGDLLAGTADDAHARLPVGANNQFLQADSAQASGVKWSGSVPAMNDFNVAWSTGSVLGYQAVNSLGGSPFPAIWHDVAAFNRTIGTPTFEQFASGAWSAATLNSAVFAQQGGTAVPVMDGTTTTACRWTWNSLNLQYDYVKWVLLAFHYTGTPTPLVDVLVESSPDATTWTMRHSSTGTSAEAFPFWFQKTDHGDHRYLRVTVTVTNARPVSVNSVRLLSYRWGGQGGGAETEHPFQWDADGNVSIGKGAAAPNVSDQLILGTNTKAQVRFGTDTYLWRDSSGWLRTNSLILDGVLSATKLGIVDAKGDLIAGTTSDTAARLPVGTDGQVLSADSSQATGLRWTTSTSTPGTWTAMPLWT